jgi:hypothetical protein
MSKSDLMKLIATLGGKSSEAYSAGKKALVEALDPSRLRYDPTTIAPAMTPTLSETVGAVTDRAGQVMGDMSKSAGQAMGSAGEAIGQAVNSVDGGQMALMGAGGLGAVGGGLVGAGIGAMGGQEQVAQMQAQQEAEQQAKFATAVQSAQEKLKVGADGSITVSVSDIKNALKSQFGDAILEQLSTDDYMALAQQMGATLQV